MTFELPTVEQARRVHYEPNTPLVDIFGTVEDREKAAVDTIGVLRAMPYRDYLRTPHWQSMRRWALERAEHACQVCAGDNRLEVHHRTYVNRGAELPADLIVLCGECHGLFHSNGKLAA